MRAFLGGFVCVGIVTTACAFLSQDASAASSQPTFMDITIQTEDWTFVPAANLDIERVEAFLAVNNSDDIIGANISVVLYQRDAQNRWQRLAWLDDERATSVSNAAKEIAEDLPEVAVRDLIEKVGIELDPEADTASYPSSDAEVFGKGVLADDPYHIVVESLNDPSELIGFLVGIGYPAANVDIDISELGIQEKHVTIDDVLDRYADTLEYGIKHPQSTMQERIDAAVASSSQNWCWPNTTISNLTAWSAWSCGGWVQVGEAEPTANQQLWHFPYVRYGFRSRTRDITVVCWDCSATSITQTQDQQAEQHGFAQVVSTNGQQPPRSQAPAAPNGPHPAINSCSPSENTVTFNWTPPDPGC